MQNLTSGIKWRMINEKKKFFGGYSSEDFCCLWLFLFLRSKYKNEWIDLCAEHGHRWWRKNSHRWSLFQKRVPARCQLEFVRKVDVSYRQSFFEHHSFSLIGLILLDKYQFLWSKSILSILLSFNFFCIVQIIPAQSMKTNDDHVLLLEVMITLRRVTRWKEMIGRIVEEPYWGTIMLLPLNIRKKNIS